MTEGFHITIPDFDEEEFSSTPIPFGRTPGSPFTAFGHTSRDNGVSSIPSSPATTSMASERAERGYFHSRQDSLASDDSAHSHSASALSAFKSQRQAVRSVHSSQSSIAAGTSVTGASSFSKKPSFASIRNAFKSSAAKDIPPPVPLIDHQAYPALQNPFKSAVGPSRKGSTTSPVVAQGTRPPTPNTKTPIKSKVYSRSHHSQSGSIINLSDGGSDNGFAFGTPLSSTPPVPKVPTGAFGHRQRSETPPNYSDVEDDHQRQQVQFEHQTPADFAFHAIFLRFIAAAEPKMESYVKEPIDREPLLTDLLGPGVDLKFDGLIESFAKIGQKNPKVVIQAILRWRVEHILSPEVIRHHNTVSPTALRPNGRNASIDHTSLLQERQAQAAFYLSNRVLISVLQDASKDALGEAMGFRLEETVFEHFKRPDLKALITSANHKINADTCAMLLGLIARLRFVSVTDRFVSELGPVALGQVSRDSEARFEALVRGMKYIPIKVWPPEAFEEAAELMEALAKTFERAHGQKLKPAFAESLTQMLHPIGKTAQAEVNHPQWANAIESIFPKASQMLSKSRYWHIAYPLVITSLCVAPHQFFLKTWVSVFELSAAKVKEKSVRLLVMNGMLRLIWTYLYRCQESASVTSNKLDALLRPLLPLYKTTIMPNDEQPRFYGYILHFILSKHFEYGKDLCFELLQESLIKNAPSREISTFVSPDRITIAVDALLLTLSLLEREEAAPMWPSSSDFTILPSSTDYPHSSDMLPASVASKPHIQETLDRLGTIMGVVAASCAKAVGNMSIFDDQWAASRVQPEDAERYRMSQHLDIATAYPVKLNNQIISLRLCLHTWPRFLPHVITSNTAIEVLLHSIIHIEPSLADAALGAIKRMMRDTALAIEVLLQSTSFIFESQAAGSVKMAGYKSRLFQIWANLVDVWVAGFNPKAFGATSEEYKKSFMAAIDQVESGSLFMMSMIDMPTHRLGLTVARSILSLLDRVRTETGRDDQSAFPHCVLDLLQSNGAQMIKWDYITGLHQQLEVDRLAQWKMAPPSQSDLLLHMADSDQPSDRKIWQNVYAIFLQCASEYPTQSLNLLRDKISSALSKQHQLVAYVAGLSPRVPTSVGKMLSLGPIEEAKMISEHQDVIDQWLAWLKILSSTAIFTEPRSVPQVTNKDHSRAFSEADFEKERFMTTKGIFQYVAPFLDSELAQFRTAAVFSLTFFQPAAYTAMLDDLTAFAARQIFDASRPKTPSSSSDNTRRQEHLHTIVGRVYYLTGPQLSSQHSHAKQTAIMQAVKFIRTTQAFLSSPLNRENPNLQRLRRYFCGTVECLLNSLSQVPDPDQFFPSKLYLSLYRLCEEWCQYGPQTESLQHQLIKMQRNASTNSVETGMDSSTFAHQTRLLSEASVGALASLLCKAYSSDIHLLASPQDRNFTDEIRPLSSAHILERLSAFMSANELSVCSHGKRSLRTVLSSKLPDSDIRKEILHLAFVRSTKPESLETRIFEVVTEVITGVDDHGFTFCQAICLGLSNLCHSELSIRRNGFAVVSAIHDQSSGLISLGQFEGAISSTTPGIYMHAHRIISDRLAGEHPMAAAGIVAEFSSWLSSKRHEDFPDRLPLLLMQSLENWVANIDFSANENTTNALEIHASLYHLLALTARFSHSHPEQVHTIWLRLVDPPHESNGAVIIQFLLEQSQRVGSEGFATCAAMIISFLCQSAIGDRVFARLCSELVPSRMPPSHEHKLIFPDPKTVDLWADIDALFAEQPRLQVGPAVFALLFLVDVSFESPYGAQDHIPILLHLAVLHIDNRHTFVRKQARRLFIRIVQSWAGPQAKFIDRSRSSSLVRAAITHHDNSAEALFWEDADTTEQIQVKMAQLCQQLLEILRSTSIPLSQDWATLSLSWATSCPILPIAYQSLRIFCALKPTLTQHHLPQLLHRLANTIAASDQINRTFTFETLVILKMAIKRIDYETALLPHLYWCAVACLSTTVEKEFMAASELIECLLCQLDFTDGHTVELITSQLPLAWSGQTTLQGLLLTGLRSSATSPLSYRLLEILSTSPTSSIIAGAEGRVLDLFIAILPRCLHAMSTEDPEGLATEFAVNIARLAESEGKVSVGRILTSFAKKRFRTKDDFLRQSVSSLREHWGQNHWSRIIIMFLGMLLNNAHWMQIQVLSILKILFQQRETRQSVEMHGSELMMPLLRLLDSALASAALDVLEEPLTVTGGLPPKHVLRMSMTTNSAGGTLYSGGEIFGVPEETGWCIAQVDRQKHSCRSNVFAVWESCKLLSDLTAPQLSLHEQLHDQENLSENDIKELVHDLHELQSFFQEDIYRSSHEAIHEDLNDRVAAILAKSNTAGIPDTPFEDVFRSRNGSQYHSGNLSAGEDDSSGSDSDAFVFDSRLSNST